MAAIWCICRFASSQDPAAAPAAAAAAWASHHDPVAAAAAAPGISDGLTSAAEAANGQADRYMAEEYMDWRAEAEAPAGSTFAAASVEEEEGVEVVGVSGVAAAVAAAEGEEAEVGVGKL